MVLQDKWDKTQRIIVKLTRMNLEDSEGMHWARMESIIGFLIYFSMKYRDINPYLKGLHLILDSWIMYREK